jgi:hypothetical protein
MKFNARIILVGLVLFLWGCVSNENRTSIYLKNSSLDHETIDIDLTFNRDESLNLTLAQDLVSPSFQNIIEVVNASKSSLLIDVSVPDLLFSESIEFSFNELKENIIIVISEDEVSINYLDSKPPCVRCPKPQKLVLEED